MGAGPLHLLKSGLAAPRGRGPSCNDSLHRASTRVPSDGDCVTFELGAALAGGVAEAVRLVLPTCSIRKLWTGGLGLRWWPAKPDEDLLVRRSWRFQYTGNHS